MDEASSIEVGSKAYVTIHAYLRKHNPKSGVCDECGADDKRTEFALIKGRQYTRNREDYRELCKRCHNAYDEIGGSRWRGVRTKRLEAPERPECACGCGTAVEWLYSHSRWGRYYPGHYRNPPSRETIAVQPVSSSKICGRCGQEFTPSRSDAVFCSKACKAANRRAEKRDHVRQVCHQCGTVFSRNRYDRIRHCSRSCAAKCQHAGGDCPSTEEVVP